LPAGCKVGHQRKREEAFFAALGTDAVAQICERGCGFGLGVDQLDRPSLFDNEVLGRLTRYCLDVGWAIQHQVAESRHQFVVRFVASGGRLLVADIVGTAACKTDGGQ
jgi:hypothetical protein